MNIGQLLGRGLGSFETLLMYYSLSSDAFDIIDDVRCKREGFTI